MDESMFRFLARQAGFAETGFSSAADFKAQQRLVKSQPPLAERRQLRFFPQQDDPRTKSLAVLLWPYEEEAMPGWGCVFVDSYYAASNAAYHATRKLEEQILAAGGFARANAPYPAREAALRAGMGLLGKSGLLITPRFGTRVVLILMATDIKPERADCEASSERSCLECGRCAAACPSGALDRRGMSHPERCMRNFMMEGVVVPESLRARMGMRLLGCDICQRVCPMQPPRPQQRSEDIALDRFVTSDAQLFSKSVEELARRVGRNVARPQRVRAQAALLAGNRADRKDLPVLLEWAQSPFAAVREHALYAVRRLEEAGAFVP